MTDAAGGTAFDPQAAGWLASTAEWIAALCDQPLEPLGFISDASNATMLCTLGDDGLAQPPRSSGSSSLPPGRSRGAGGRLYAIYKPRRGERPLRDFPDGTLCQREVAAFRVSERLGWGLVPPTVLREGPAGAGSVQAFVAHDPAEHYFTLVDDDRWRADLARIAVFDLLLNNTDRKGGHILHGVVEDRLYGIDHGLTFHVEAKLRTVVWDLGPFRLQERWRADLLGLADAIEQRCAAELEGLLDPGELRVLGRRARRAAALPKLPTVPEGSRPYPWPPL